MTNEILMATFVPILSGVGAELLIMGGRAATRRVAGRLSHWLARRSAGKATAPERAP